MPRSRLRLWSGSVGGDGFGGLGCVNINRGSARCRAERGDPPERPWRAPERAARLLPYWDETCAASGVAKLF